MSRYVLIVSLVGSLLLAGCHAYRKGETPNDARTANVDSMQNTPVVFVFAESPLLNISSDAMATQFRVDGLPVDVTEIDSVTALKTVYEILLDSLLDRDAASFDLRTVPELYRQYQQLRFDMVMRVMWKELIADSVQVGDSEVAAAYTADHEKYKVPDQYRARHIMISAQGLKKSDDSAQYVGKSEAGLDSLAHIKITELQKRIADGASFDTLAIMYSQDPGSARNGGDLGFFTPSRMVPPFDSTVLHTPIGTVSGIIKTKYGWHIVKVEAFAPEHYIPLDSVREQIRGKVAQTEMADRGSRFVDSLRNSGKVVIDIPALKMPDSLHKPSDPIACINPDDKKYGNDTLCFQDYSEQIYAFQRMKKISRPLTFQEKQELVQKIAVRGHLLRAARQRGFYNRPEIESQAGGIAKRYATSILKKRILDESYEPSEAAIKDYYDSHIQGYEIERPLCVQHIIFSDSATAENVRDLLMSGADFMQMAEKYYPGDPDIRLVAADLGWIGPYDMPGPFWRTALATREGDISHPVKTEFGYHLIKVTKKNFSDTFETAKLKIVPLLKSEHKEKLRREFVDSRIGKALVIHWDRLNQLYRVNVGVPAAPGTR